MAITYDSKHKKEITDKAIKEGGFYGKNGVWNSIITFAGDSTLYRHRVETIIVKNNKYVFVKKKFDGSYFLPGGSTEKDVDNLTQAINECREEAHIEVTNVEATGLNYKEKHDPPAWAKGECEILWNGSFTEIYVGTFEGKYEGNVNKVDEDPFIRSGQWYTTQECFSFFRKEHREALLWYLKNNKNNEDTITESYISNYFSNKKMLKKISHNPDIERSAVDQMIAILKKEYLNLNSKSNIQREKQKKDIEFIFHPIIGFDFNDKTTITIAICFDEKSFTPAAAIHTDEYGDIIVVYPSFFKEKKEDQVFTLLHEIGHIRLNHLYKYNSPPRLLAKTNDEYRLKKMSKGKVMYPELNADLYAILNGASMYSILNSTYSKDTDDEYDYRFTNAELASRYAGVFNQYNKLRGFNEASDMKALNMTNYDIACLVLYEKVYNNEDTSDFSPKEKDILYNLIYEFTINKFIKNDAYVVKAEKEYQEALENLSSKEALYKKYENICESKIEDLSKEDLNFKYEIESNKIDDMTSLENELYILRDRFENASTSVMFARDKSYNEYVGNLLNENCMICPNGKINEKALAFYSNKNTIENFIEKTIDELLDKIESSNVKMESTNTVVKYLYLIESLSSKERNKIPLEKFGIPEERKYPLDTKKHVYSAIRLFGHSEEKYRAELAKNIFTAMKHYKIPMDYIGSQSKLRNYM